MDILKTDPVMFKLIDDYGEKTLEPAESPFRRIVESIINQQLSTESAQSIKDDLFVQMNITPDNMVDAESESLSNIGISSQKIEYIKRVSAAFRDGQITPDALDDKSNSEAMQVLSKIKGIGPWTAKMYLMFGLGRRNLFPVEDLGIRRGMKRLFGKIERKQMVNKAKEWIPQRSIASLYVWEVAHDSKFSKYQTE